MNFYIVHVSTIYKSILGLQPNFEITFCEEPKILRISFIADEREFEKHDFTRHFDY